MSNIASISQASHFARPAATGSSNEASEPKAAEKGESSASEASEGGGRARSAPPAGTGQIFDIRA